MNANANCTSSQWLEVEVASWQFRIWNCHDFAAIKELARAVQYLVTLSPLAAKVANIAATAAVAARRRRHPGRAAAGRLEPSTDHLARVVALVVGSTCFILEM